MTSPLPHSQPSLELRLSYLDYIEMHFLRLAYREQRMLIVGDGWTTRSKLDCAPGERVGLQRLSGDRRQEAVVRVDEALCHLILNGTSLVVRIAAINEEQVDAARRALRDGLPGVAHDDREASAHFWWWDSRSARQNATVIEIPIWSEIADNYASSTQQQVEPLAQWLEGPGGRGRLMLFHGEPGTGKTSLVRTLAGRWRGWADFHFVTDPENFLQNPSYLVSLAGGESSKPHRWRVIVLEDAGEFLAVDARRHAGQSVSRLLNLCDGVLGQSMRALVLITTNEPLAALHPALSRPGRCAAQVCFEELEREAILRWCASRDVMAPEVSRASLAELFAHACDDSIAIRRPGPVGFVPA